MRLEFSHHFHTRHCTVLTGAVPKECRPYLRKNVLPGRRDFGNFPFQVRHCSVSTKPLVELDLFVIWGKSWVLNNLCNVVHPNECSEPAVCESFEPTCALGSKIGPILHCYHQTFQYFCTDETSCSRERKELPSFIWKVLSLKETPLFWTLIVSIITSTSYPKWWLLEVWRFYFFLLFS